MQRLTFPLLMAAAVLALACFFAAGTASAETIGPPVFAGVFGSRDLSVPNPNDPGNNYTMVLHAGNNQDAHNALAYDAVRGWGFDVIYDSSDDFGGYGGRSGSGQFGPFDNSPNNRNKFDDTLPDELYDSFIGMKNYLTELESGTPDTPAIGDPPEGGIFRIDVPNGYYRFVGAFADADNVHAHRVLAEDGGSGPPESIGPNHVVLVHNFDQAQQTIGLADSTELGEGVFARVGFEGFLPPEPQGAGVVPMFVNMDASGMATGGAADSPVLQVTQGYVRIHLLQGDSNDGPGGPRDANGTDIVLLEVHPVVPEPATLAMLAAGSLLGAIVWLRRRRA